MVTLAAPPRVHPAKARRIAAQMPPAAAHDTLLRPLGGGDAATLIATLPIDRFVDALFDRLAGDDWAATLAPLRRMRQGTDGVLELGLPTHRKAQVALFEILCRTPGFPRLDPKRIAGHGMVLRRLRAPGRWDGWMTGPRSIGGWTALAHADDDPGGAAWHGANHAARTLLAARRAPVQLREEVIPLHVVPPEICAHLGRTVLFGLIPVASDARSSDPPPRLDYAALPVERRQPIVDHLSSYLKPRAGVPIALPRAGQALRRKWNVLDPIARGADGTPLDPQAPQLAAFGTFLQQLAVELGALEGPAGDALMAVFAAIRLPMRKEQGKVVESIDAARFLRDACAILLERKPNTGDAVRMPLEWPAIGDELGGRLTRAALDCLTERHAALARSPGKFEVADDLFQVRGFVRVAGHDGCQEKLVWSPPSEPFRVLPWWDGDGPGVKISLPDLSQLKRIMPNVAFEMPPALTNLLGGDAKELAEGKGSTNGPQVGFLCSFSIPIITLCAFIVLNIFLSLFDLIFRWKMFLKVCLPIPTIVPAPPEEADA